MTQLYEYQKDWTPEKKNAHKNLIFDLIAKLRSYCEIEIYLQEYTDITGLDMTKQFYSEYVDRNKEQARFVLVKYGLTK